MPADLIVAGAGPAGCEAAWAAAEAGREVLLITSNLDTVFQASEPVAGRSGLLGLVTGGEVTPPRQLHRKAKGLLERHPRIHLQQSGVSRLLSDGDRVTGVGTWEGVDHQAPAVVLATGSFMGASYRIGDHVQAAGRPGELAYPELFADLLERGACFRQVTVQADGELRCHAITVLPPLRGLHACGFAVEGWLSFGAAADAGRNLWDQALSVSSTGSV